jgi:putative phage-type endonuclease
MKAKNLDIGVDAATDFDPRPARFINNPGYTSMVRNMLVNFQHNDPIPLDQSIEPANPYAVSHDHWYLSISDEDRYLAENCITSITLEQRVNVETSTRGQGKSSVWKTERCKRLQSSNFGRICKATDATDFPKLAYSLTKYTPAKSAAIKHGHQYEPVAVAKFEALHKVKTTECGIMVSSTHPYIAASADRLLGEDTVVEVKCPYTARHKKVNSTTVAYLQGEGDELTLDNTHEYFYQIQGQMFCTGRSQCYFVVYTKADVKYFIVQRDEVFISNMVEKLKGFYTNYFQAAVLRRFYYKDYYSYNFK